MSGAKAMAESRLIRALLAAALVLATVRSHASGGGCLGEERRGVSRLPRSGTAEVVATGVLDGDTFVAFIDGAPRRVRRDCAVDAFIEVSHLVAVQYGRWTEQDVDADALADVNESVHAYIAHVPLAELV